jgi:hypothetical protein
MHFVVVSCRRFWVPGLSINEIKREEREVKSFSWETGSHNIFDDDSDAIRTVLGPLYRDFSYFSASLTHDVWFLNSFGLRKVLLQSTQSTGA